MRPAQLGATLGLCALVALAVPSLAQADPCKDAGRTASDEARAVRAHGMLAKLGGTRELDRFQMEPLLFIGETRTLSPASRDHLRAVGERVATLTSSRIGVALAPGTDLASEALRRKRIAVVRAQLLAAGARPRQIAVLDSNGAAPRPAGQADLLVLQGQLSFVSSTELTPGPPGPPPQREQGAMHADRRRR